MTLQLTNAKINGFLLLSPSVYAKPRLPTQPTLSAWKPTPGHNMSRGVLTLFTFLHREKKRYSVVSSIPTSLTQLLGITSIFVIKPIQPIQSIIQPITQRSLGPRQGLSAGVADAVASQIETSSTRLVEDGEGFSPMIGRWRYTIFIITIYILYIII